jgi:hypothetical protein
MRLSKFEDLDCWKEARQLTRQIYEAIGRNQTWQKDLRLCGQIQGAAVSVMADIAEGFTGIPTRNLSSSYLWLWHLQPRFRAISTWQ